jgi:glycosyltransferase involved in cell wall biosynthesis
MRLGLFLTSGFTNPNGHSLYEQGLLEGLTQQDRHQVVVFVSDRDPVPALPEQHEVVVVAKPRRRVFSALSFDLYAEGAATVAATKAHLDALVGIGQWAMPRPPRVPRIVVLFEAAFLRPSPWGVYSTLVVRQFLTASARNLRGAEAVVCLSEHGRNEINRGFHFPSERIHVAPPSVQPFPPVEHSRFQPPGRYVLVVGWFHPRKDAVLALRSWRHAMELGLDADLVLAGTEGPIDRRHGALGRRILDAVGAELAARVHFTGTVPRADLGALYRDASALLMTSLHEGFGIPAIEAFSMGVPVVAVDRTSLPEVVGPVGTIAPADPASLGAALLAAVRNPGDRAARRAYASTFTPARQVGSILAVADRLGRHSTV